MSVAEITAELGRLQQKLIKALQDEYFCDDVSPPPEAFGWSEQALRDFMESGGEVQPTVGPQPTAAPPAAAPPPPSAIGMPALAAPPAPPTAAGRPIILCLGDALTEFGSHIVNQPMADVGSSKHKASLSVTVDPVASEFLRSTETDNPGIEHGPGWVALLARDYAWRTAADVINRGHSGMNSAMLLADLPELLGAFRADDVVAVTLMIGANDAVADGEPTREPPPARARCAPAAARVPSLTVPLPCASNSRLASRCHPRSARRATALATPSRRRASDAVPVQPRRHPRRHQGEPAQGESRDALAAAGRRAAMVRERRAAASAHARERECVVRYRPEHGGAPCTRAHTQHAAVRKFGRCTARAARGPRRARARARAHRARVRRRAGSRRRPS